MPFFSPPARRVLGTHGLVLAAFTALAAGMLWPLPRQLYDHVFRAKYYWDAYTNTMLLGARVAGTLGSGAIGPYDSPFFAPIPDSIAFNENLFGLALLYAPFLLASKNPLFSYNAVLLLSLVLSSYFTFLLVRRLSGSVPAALIAGVAFPYCPYAFFEMGRLQLVATQWIPLSFLLLHRAVEGQRLRDVLGLGLVYVLQVGTCLYYAMFLLPLLALVGAWLVVQKRPSPRFFAQLGGTGLVAGALVMLMIAPYFEARKNFDLTRSEDFAGSFDGKLSFFANVAPSNRTLDFLHHEPKTEAGAHEEIAFPGFTIATLALLAVLVPIVRALMKLPVRRRVRKVAGLVLWLAGTLGAAALVTLGTRSMLPGAIVIGLAALAWTRLSSDAPLVPAPIALYTWTLVLAILLFLGLSPLEYEGSPVRGLYYYLHTYAPGWNGIRKISRQAIMTSLLFVVLAGFGAAFVLSAIKHELARALLTLVLAGLVAFEFREAPLPLEPVFSGARVPSAYRFLAKQPGKGHVAVVPAGDGLRLFRAHSGQAYLNYLSLFHRHRTLNGKSSFIPPVTRSYNQAQARLPSENATRVLRQLGAQFVLVHAWELRPGRRERLVAGLIADSANYKLLYQRNSDYVFELLRRPDEPDTLLETPALPPGELRQVPASELAFSASVFPEEAHRMGDGAPETRWATRRQQRAGDWFEIRLKEARELVALELDPGKTIDDLPLGFKLEVSEDGSSYRSVVERPKLHLFHEQVFSPRSFVYRVVLPPKTLAERLRVTILDPMPGRWLTVHEAKVWVR